MALGKRAALGVLPRQPHRSSFAQQRAEGERLGSRPIDALAKLDRLGARIEEALDRAVGVKISWHCTDFFADVFKRFDLDAGDPAAGIIMVTGRLHAGPAPIEPIRTVGLVALTGF